MPGDAMMEFFKYNRKQLFKCGNIPAFLYNSKSIYLAHC
jgi:hypothetical protein